MSDRIERIPKCDYCNEDLEIVIVENPEMGEQKIIQVIDQPHLTLGEVGFCCEKHAKLYWKTRKLYKIRGYDYENFGDTRR